MPKISISLNDTMSFMLNFMININYPQGSRCQAAHFMFIVKYCSDGQMGPVHDGIDATGRFTPGFQDGRGKVIAHPSRTGLYLERGDRWSR